MGMSEDSLFKWVVAEFTVLIALNMISLLAGDSSLWALKASSSQWWGSVTSIGLYDSWESTIALVVLPFLWFALNTRIRGMERRNRSLFLMIESVAVAIVSNYVWEISAHGPHYTSGVSGFEVAVGGTILVFSVVNLVSIARPNSLLDSPQFRPTDKRTTKRFLAFIYIVLIALMILVPITLVAAADPTINTQVHVDSLLFSIGVTTIFQGVVVLRRMLAKQAMEIDIHRQKA
jgi:hypothetical protein